MHYALSPQILDVLTNEIILKWLLVIMFLLISADLEPQLAHSRHFNTS